MGTVRALPTYYSPIGFQKLVVSTTPIGFTLPASPQTRAVIFGVETAPIRFRVDGSDPNATDGMLVSAGDVVEITNVEMINNFKAVATGSDSTLQIHYFGGGF